MKDYRSNKKYFVQKSPIPYHVVFVALMAVVAFCFLLVGRRSYPIAFAVLAVGSVMEVIVCQRYVSDKYFETFLSEERKLFVSEFEEVYRPIDPRLYHRNAVGSATVAEKHGEPVYGAEYRYLEDDFERLGVEMQIRLGRDGIARSSVYCFTGIQIDARRVCLMAKYIGMTEDRAVTDKAAFPYAELSAVTLETRPLTCSLAAAHCNEMVFRNKAGTEVFRLPVHGSCADEDVVKKLCKLIRESAETEL